MFNNTKCVQWNFLNREDCFQSLIQHSRVAFCEFVFKQYCCFIPKLFGRSLTFPVTYNVFCVTLF